MIRPDAAKNNDEIVSGRTHAFYLFKEIQRISRRPEAEDDFAAIGEVKPSPNPGSYLLSLRGLDRLAYCWRFRGLGVQPPGREGG